MTINTTCESYWRKTGYKFMGTDDELQALCADCGHQFEISDEEGYFDSFYCTIDFKECDKCCNKHHPILDEWIKPFFDNCCRMEKIG